MLGFLKRLLNVKELPEKLSYEEARAVLESHKKQLEDELAERTDAEPEMLYYLAERGAPKVRRKVAANPAPLRRRTAFSPRTPIPTSGPSSPRRSGGFSPTCSPPSATASASSPSRLCSVWPAIS